MDRFSSLRAFVAVVEAEGADVTVRLSETREYLHLVNHRIAEARRVICA
jgi:hypothetical protein